MIVMRVVRWTDNRLGTSSFARKALNKIFPDHWSFMLGEIAMYSFLLLVLTGIYLSLFYIPSEAKVTYDGSYGPLKGVEVSEAFNSVMRLSFDVRAGLVMRQTHHWAALVMMAAVIAHLCRIFFTGAFRRPREINWIIGVSLLLLTLANGFTGYSLGDDQLSGTGLRIAYSVVISIPLIGEWIAFLLFGGDFPGENVLDRFFVIHIMIVPAAIFVLLGAHLAILVRHKHTQWALPGRTNDNVVGAKLWPTFAAKSLGLMFLTWALLAALGGLVQINPIWIWGPFEEAAVSSGSQPDWYVGWMEGALRLMPNWEIRAFGWTVPNPFWGGVLIPGLTFGLLFAWPFLEARFTHEDQVEHHLLDRPRDRPVRTALGVATLTFYLVLFIAGGNDVLAAHFDVSVNAITYTLRVLVFVLPALNAFIAYKLCKELARRSPLPQPPSLIVRRTPEGGYVDVEPPPVPVPGGGGS
jgi:ubiquinol-cytochrome c reductase cytochrome b subunit